MHLYKNIGHVVLNVYIFAHMVLKETFGLINVYIYNNIGDVVLNVYICKYGFERKNWFS